MPNIKRLFLTSSVILTLLGMSVTAIADPPLPHNQTKPNPPATDGHKVIAPAQQRHDASSTPLSDTARTLGNITSTTSHVTVERAPKKPKHESPTSTISDGKEGEDSNPCISFPNFPSCVTCLESDQVSTLGTHGYVITSDDDQKYRITGLMHNDLCRMMRGTPAPATDENNNFCAFSLPACASDER